MKTVKVVALNGLKFTLRPRIMKEDDSSPYTATRAGVRRAFQGAPEIAYRSASYFSPLLAEVYVCDNEISIGCCRFRGTDFRVLRAWALNKSK